MKRLIVFRPGVTDGLSYTGSLNDEGKEQTVNLADKLRTIVGNDPVQIIHSGAPCTEEMAAIVAMALHTTRPVIELEAFFPSGKKSQDLVPSILSALDEHTDSEDVTNIVFGHHDYFPDLLLHYIPDPPSQVVKCMPDKAEGWCFDFTDPENPQWSFISAQR